MSSFGECTLKKEIYKTDEAIKSCYSRIANLEQQLRRTDKEDLKRELQEVRKLLTTNEEQLHKLHHHNTSPFLLGIVTAGVIFLVCVIYILVNGSDF